MVDGRIRKLGEQMSSTKGNLPSLTTDGQESIDFGQNFLSVEVCEQKLSMVGYRENTTKVSSV
jgi:hypothetical protein